MPKKKKSDEEDSELEELIDEEKLKEITQDIEEKSNINENQFREFLQTEFAVPVLEEITGEQELGGKIFFTPGMDASVQDDDGTFRYDAQAKEDEPKYQGDYSSTRQNLEEVDTIKIGRDIGQPKVREAGFVRSVEQNNSQMQEKYQEAQRIDMEKVGKDINQPQVREAEQKKSDYVVK